MQDQTIVLPRKGLRGKKRRESLRTFASQLMVVQRVIPFKVSARGWCYQLEQMGTITKDQFDVVERLINDCRKKGILPWDFTADKDNRNFSCLSIPTGRHTSIPEFLQGAVQDALDCEVLYQPDWWEGEKYYIEMLVEKIDLVTLFEPVCREFHVPIAPSRGSSSINQRGQMATRFALAEGRGQIPVLLYFGDHDPYGLLISDVLLRNFGDLTKSTGFDPSNLEIDRFGLNFDQIQSLNLTWIDNLTSGSGKNPHDYRPGSPTWKIVHEYINKYGERKCEANALIVRVQEARALCRSTILQYVGDGFLDRCQERREEVNRQFAGLRSGEFIETINQALNMLRRKNREHPS